MQSLTLEITQLHNEDVYAFWHNEKCNGFLSNLFSAPIILDGLTWPTSEHLYQALKHEEPAIIEKIRMQSVALKSKFVARKYCKKRNRWPSDDEKLKYMRQALTLKFTQHPALMDMLAKTDNKRIIENSPVDYFWGVGDDGSGKNMMGVLLMEIRNNHRAKIDFLSARYTVNS